MNTQLSDIVELSIVEALSCGPLANLDNFVSFFGQLYRFNKTYHKLEIIKNCLHDALKLNENDNRIVQYNLILNRLETIEQIIPVCESFKHLYNLLEHPSKINKNKLINMIKSMFQFTTDPLDYLRCLNETIDEINDYII